MIQHLRSWWFVRRHRKACRHTIECARELSLAGHAKRRAQKLSVARRIRDELGLAPDGRLA
jgi:hypothetical protein